MNFKPTHLLMALAAVCPLQLHASDYEKQKLAELRKYPSEKCLSDPTAAKGRIAVTIDLGRHYGARDLPVLVDVSMAEVARLLECPGITDAERTMLCLDATRCQEYIGFIHENEEINKEIREYQDKLIQGVDLSLKENRKYKWMSQLNKARILRDAGQTLDAKLELTDLISSIYCDTDENPVILDGKRWVNINASLLMAEIMHSGKEYSQEMLYLNRILKDLDMMPLLVQTSLMQKLAERYDALKDRSEFSFYSRQQEGSVENNRRDVSLEMWNRQKKISDIREEYIRDTYGHQAGWTDPDIDIQYAWSKRLNKKMADLNEPYNKGDMDAFMTAFNDLWEDWTNLVTNNYVSFEQHSLYFDFLVQTIKAMKGKIGPETVTAMRDKFIKTMPIYQMTFLNLMGLGEARTWDDFDNRRLPYYSYSLETNLPHRDATEKNFFAYFDAMAAIDPEFAPTLLNLKNLWQDALKQAIK